MNLLSIILRVLFLAALVLWQSWLHEYVHIPELYMEPLYIITGFLLYAIGLHLGILLLALTYRRRKKIPKGRTDNVLLGMTNLYYLLLVSGVIATVFALFGVNFKTFFTSLSIVAAAIAIVTKDYLMELISGFIVSFSKEIILEDYIKIGEHKGQVIDINLTKIALVNEDDDVIFIPNNKVFSSEIINYTRKPIKKVSIEFEMDLKFLKTIEALEQDLVEALKDYHEHIEQSSFFLKVVALRKDNILLKFQYVIDQLNLELERDIRKKTVRRVFNFIKASQSEEEKRLEEKKTGL